MMVIALEHFAWVFFSKSDLWRHAKVCPYKNQNENSEFNDEKRQKIRSSLLLFANRQKSNSVSVELHAFVTSKMNHDEITKTALDDDIIISYGQFLLDGKGARKNAYISQKMRLLARLLLCMKEKTGNRTLLENLKPAYFDNIIQCVKDMTGYSPQNSEGELLPSFQTPSLPLKLGYALDCIFALVKGVALRKKDKVLQEDMENLTALYNCEWSVKLSSAALRTLGNIKFNSVQLLPLTEDLLALKEFCVNAIISLSKELREEPSLEVWRQLAETVVSRLTVFNKRRGNECSEILLDRYVNRKNYNHVLHEDVLASLTNLEHQLMKRLQLVHVRGKTGRQVPVLIPDKETVAALDIIVEKRESVGVSTTNKSLFPAPTRSSQNALRGYVCLNTVVSRLDNLEKPDLIKSTKLRKYIATVTQISGLNQTELEWLWNHLGHNPDVHKQYYRLQDSAIMVAKVSRLLMAVDSGKGAGLAGKSLSDLSLDDLPDLDPDDDEDGGDIDSEDDKPGCKGIYQNFHFS